MNCRIFFLATFSVFAGLINAQKGWYHYTSANNYANDYKKMTDEVYRFNLEKYKNSKYVGGNCEQFAMESSLELYEDLRSGSIYMSLEGKEGYVRKVLSTLVKDADLANTIRIFFYRDGSLNASMSESGVLRLNIGTLARLKNEAELAMLLGHEVGHFMNEDDVKRYARYKQMSLWGGDVDWSMKWKWYGGMVMTVTPNYWYSREQEETADLASVNLVKNSPYSLRSASELYRRFKREEIRAEIKYGKGNASYRSHPDPGDRVKMVKGFATDSSHVGKKDFVVDSAEFMKLKELCYMETINAGFASNDLDEIMTLSFSRYLMEPENDYNLAVLIEALRRYKVLNEQKSFNKSFILYPYQTKKKEASENYAFLEEEKPSILSYLSKGFVDVWKEEYSSIRAVDLLNQQVTEFTTYAEAYDYFKKKAQERNCRIAEHYRYFGPNAESADVESYRKINDLFLSNDYLGRTADTSKHLKTVVVIPMSTYSILRKFQQDKIRQKEEQVNGAIFGQIKNDQGNKVVMFEDLSFNDQHLVRSLMGLCNSQLNMQHDFTSRSKMSWTEVHPEAYSLFAKNGLTDLYICMPYTTTGADGKDPKAVACYYRINLASPVKGVPPMMGKKMVWSASVLDDGQVFSRKLSKELDAFVKTEK